MRFLIQNPYSEAAARRGCRLSKHKSKWNQKAHFLFYFFKIFFFPILAKGFTFSVTQSSVTVRPQTSLSEGRSNIGCCKIFSTIERKPRAPVFWSIAFFAIAFNASDSKLSSIPSSSNNFLYCFTSEFFGSWRTWRAYADKNPYRTEKLACETV